MNDDEILARIMHHEENADVTISECVSWHIKLLGHHLYDKWAVYLDTKYWIILRDVMLGRRNDVASVELAETLRVKAKEGLLFCPISEATFIELMRQSDRGTRRTTAEMIDQLSMGVSLVSAATRVEQELAHYVHSVILGVKSLYELEKLIWTKVSYSLGQLNPHSAVLDGATELVLQKAVFDHLWNVPLTEMIDCLEGSDDPEPNLFQDLSVRLNREKAVRLVRSYKQLYSDELEGAIDINGAKVELMLEKILLEKGRLQKKYGSAAVMNYRGLLKVLMHQDLKRGRHRDVLRSSHIGASLHAAIAWDKQRKFHPNDFLDFSHAAAALGYCDVFLTELALAKLVSSNHLKLNQFYECAVIADVSEAAQHVKSLSSGPNR